MVRDHGELVSGYPMRCCYSPVARFPEPFLRPPGSAFADLEAQKPNGGFPDRATLARASVRKRGDSRSPLTLSASRSGPIIGKRSTADLMSGLKAGSHPP